MLSCSFCFCLHAFLFFVLKTITMRHEKTLSSVTLLNHILSCPSSAVIKMEGGTDHDLRILDLPSEEEEEREKLALVSGGAEPPKREDVKNLDGDRKPSVEKDKNEKVCFALCQCSLGSRDFTVLCC